MFHSNKSKVKTVFNCPFNFELDRVGLATELTVEVVSGLTTGVAVELLDRFAELSA